MPTPRDTRWCTRRRARWQKEGNLGTTSRGQLGRGNRIQSTLAPKHPNAEPIESIEGASGSVVCFPPDGEYWNPVELLFNDLKQVVIQFTNTCLSRSRDPGLHGVLGPCHLAGFFLRSGSRTQPKGEQKWDEVDKTNPKFSHVVMVSFFFFSRSVSEIAHSNEMSEPTVPAVTSFVPSTRARTSRIPIGEVFTSPTTSPQTCSSSVSLTR